MDRDAQSSDFLLNRRQYGDDRQQGILILRHQPSNMIDVLASSNVFFDVALDVLESYVQYPERSLNGVQLGYGEELDLRLAAVHPARMP